MKSRKITLAFSNYQTLASALVEGMSSSSGLRMSLGHPGGTMVNHRDEPTILRALLDGRWLIHPAGSRDNNQQVMREDWPSDDAWWKRIDLINHIASSYEFCIIPWGPESQLTGLVGIVESNNQYFNRANQNIRGIFESLTAIWDYTLSDRNEPNFRSRVVIEQDAGWLLSETMRLTSERPLICFVSPAAFDFLTDYSLSNPTWLEDEYELLGAIDGTDRQDIPWLYRPRSAESLSSMCRLSGQSVTLLAAFGITNFALIGELYDTANTMGSQSIIVRSEIIQKNIEFFYMFQFGSANLHASWVSGNKCVDIFSQIDKMKSGNVYYLLKF